MSNGQRDSYSERKARIRAQQAGLTPEIARAAAVEFLNHYVRPEAAAQRRAWREAQKIR